MKSKKVGVFAVTSLAMAGLGSNVIADNSKTDAFQEKSFIDDIKSIVDSVNAKQTYTLAQHQSHASHGSHNSHSSHRSYAIPPIEDDLRVDNDNSGIQMTSVRNERSTPTTSILPSTPAITQKLKILPGNSAKFKEIIQQMKLSLISRGYAINTVDGEIDARTRAAIYKFQAASGFQPDGKVTPEVLAALNIATE